MVEIAAFLLASYLLGSIPAAYIAARARNRPPPPRVRQPGRDKRTSHPWYANRAVGVCVRYGQGWRARPGPFRDSFPADVLAAAQGRTVFAIAQCGVAAIIGHARPIYLRLGKGERALPRRRECFSRWPRSRRF